MLNSNLTRIDPHSVALEHEARPVELPNDAVIISAGGVLPIELLKQVGIHFETKRGTE
jgi:hypothetical protein